MNLTRLIEHTRDIIADNSSVHVSEKEWDDDELTRHLNNANNQLWQRADLADEYWGLDHVLLSDLLVTTAELPGNFIQIEFPSGAGIPGEIVRLEEDISNTETGDEIEPTHLGQANFLKQDYVWKHDDKRGWFYGPANTLMFTKTSRAFDALTTRLWYKRKAPMFSRFKPNNYPSGIQIQVTPDAMIVTRCERGRMIGGAARMTLRGIRVSIRLARRRAARSAGERLPQVADYPIDREPAA